LTNIASFVVENVVIIVEDRDAHAEEAVDVSVCRHF
jgi:hypothetical protein